MLNGTGRVCRCVGNRSGGIRHWRLAPCATPLRLSVGGQSLNSLPHHSTTLDWHKREFLLWGISSEWDPDLIRGKGLNPFQVILIFHHYYFTFKKKKKNQNHYNTIAICVLKSNAYSGLQNESIICL